MTVYMLFAGLGTSIYLGAANASATSSADGAQVNVAMHFTAFAALMMLLAVILLYDSTRLVRVFAFVLALVCVGAVAIVIATTREPGEVQVVTSTNRPLAEKQLRALVAYLKSLKG